MDNRILTLLTKEYQGKPVGLSTLASALSEDESTLEDVYEPYLIMEGFIIRTPRGREVTELAYRHLGKSPVGNLKFDINPTLFD